MKGKVSMVVLLLFFVAGSVSAGYAYTSTLVVQDNPGTVTINYIEMTSVSDLDIKVSGDGSDHNLIFFFDDVSQSHYDIEYRKVGAVENKIAFIVSFSGVSELAGATLTISLLKGGNVTSGSVVLDGNGAGTIAGLVMDLSDSKQTIQLSGVIHTPTTQPLDISGITISVDGYPIGGA